MELTESSSELDALVDHVLQNPGPLIDRVMAHVGQHLTCDGTAPGSATSNDVIAGVIRNLLTPDHPAAPIPTNGAATVAPGPVPCEHQVLIDRNVLVAAAVGACDCWGDDLDCSFCAGAGGPAWITPDRRLFVEYVYPAVRALSVARAAARRQPVHNQSGGD
jgi:hypothetical protein